MKRSLLTLLLLAVAPVALAQDPGYFYVIKSKINGHVLTAEGDPALLASDRNQVAPVAMRPATGAKNQLWYVERAPGWLGVDGMHYIRNYVGGRVLDVEGWQSNVITWPRKPAAEMNQLWLFAGGKIHGLSGNEWKCLDVLYANWQFGPNVGTWSCHNNANQQWEWVRQQPTIMIGDITDRLTVAYAPGGLRFARPLTPQEADRHGIPGMRAYVGGEYKPFVMHERDVGKDLCERLVLQGLANWRLPTLDEFSKLLAAYRLTPNAKGGQSLLRIGWNNIQTWSSHETGSGDYALRQQLWPDDLTQQIWIQRNNPAYQALVTCVR